MSVPTIPEPARLIISVLCSPNHPRTVEQRLTEMLGPLEERIGPIEFGFTSYYDRELGPGILRWLFSFERLIERAELVSIKLLTNGIEQTYTIDGKRRFNLDPGLMTLGNFVLATGKNNAHRIYLDQGIFADLTLVYRSGTYRALEWTYPDYADTHLITILNRLREQYKCTLTSRATVPGPSRV